MARVFIPSLLRELAAGQQHVDVDGATVREVIERLDERFPGMKNRLIENDRLRPNLALIVDGEVSSQKLRHKVTEKSEIHFMPALSGGCKGGSGP